VTELIDPRALNEAERAAIEKRAAERGIDWSPRQATLAWRTESTTEVGRLRRRTRTVTTTALLDRDADILAWAISDDGAPAAVVVRLSRVEIADAMTGLLGLAPQLVARAEEIGADGVTVRGDLGGRDLGSIFLPLGTGPVAEQVRTALLA
jgi:hypothetical protein